MRKDTSWHVQDDTKLFFDILFHDDRNSNYIVSTSKDGVWTDNPFRLSELADLRFNGNTAYYITRNGFNGRRRDSNRCRQINAVFFDIDCHDGDYDIALPDLKTCLSKAFDESTLPRPNLFVDTGRGVQVYYVLAASTPFRVRGGNLNQKGIDFLRDVEKGLAARFEQVISDVDGCVLDRSVFDFTRVSRIPGTLNQKSRTFCRLIDHNEDYWHLKDLKAFAAISKKRCASFKRPLSTNSIGLLKSRLENVESLIELRGRKCVGSRESSCFVYYNTATQLYGPDTALDLTLSLNERFDTPLPPSDILQIKRSVDRVVIRFGRHAGEKGFYPLSASSIVEKLNLSGSEIATIGFFSTARDASRAACKELTRKRRAERDKLICELYEKGYTQHIVAKKAGCSLRTVSTVIKRCGVTRGNLKETVKSQYVLALSLKSGQCAKNCHMSWVVYGKAPSPFESARIWMEECRYACEERVAGPCARKTYDPLMREQSTMEGFSDEQKRLDGR